MSASRYDYEAHSIDVKSLNRGCVEPTFSLAHMSSLRLEQNSSVLASRKTCSLVETTPRHHPCLRIFHCKLPPSPSYRCLDIAMMRFQVNFGNVALVNGSIGCRSLWQEYQICLLNSSYQLRGVLSRKQLLHII